MHLAYWLIILHKDSLLASACAPATDMQNTLYNLLAKSIFNLFSKRIVEVMFKIKVEYKLS